MYITVSCTTEYANIKLVTCKQYSGNYESPNRRSFPIDNVYENNKSCYCGARYYNCTRKLL